MHTKFHVCMIGGMGPLSTAELFRRTVLYTKAEGDGGHVSLCVFNDPSIPDRSGYIVKRESNERTPSPLKAIKRHIRAAKRLHCRYFAVACNTAHYFSEDFEKVKGIRFINAVRDTVSYAAKAYPDRRLCVLATEGTVRADIYRKNAPLCAKTVYPSENMRRKISSLIYAIKGGVPPERCDPEAIASGLSAEFDPESTVFILGCTELSLVSEFFGDLTVVDSTDVLAASMISAAKKEFNTERFPLNTEFFRQRYFL